MTTPIPILASQEFIRQAIPDGMISPGSPAGNLLDFTEDLFEADSYLWRTDNEITVSLIFSRYEGKKNLSRLFRRIEELGFEIAVPTPFARMQAILEHWGFVGKMELCEDLDDWVEYWRKPKAPEVPDVLLPL